MMEKTNKISIPVRFLNSDYYKNLPMRVLFLHCLFKADENGEFLTTLQSLANETGLSVKQIRTAIPKLTKLVNITRAIKGQQKGKQKTFVKVCNYATYKCSNITKGNKKTDKRQQKSIVNTTVEQLYDELILLFPETVTKTLSEASILKWKDELRKLIEIDKYTPQEIKQVVEFARTNSFWQTNFLSLLKLRKNNKEGVKYYIVFKEQMNNLLKNNNNGFITGIKSNKKEGASIEELAAITHKHFGN